MFVSALCVCVDVCIFIKCEPAQDPIVVIDPFAGTGSTGIAALRTGSYFIGMDNDDLAVVRSMLMLSV